MRLTQDDIHLMQTDKQGHTYEVKVHGVMVQLPSVTTIINYVVNKPAIPDWSYNTGVKSTAKYLSNLYEDLGEEFTVPTDGEIKLALAAEGRTHTDAMNEGAKRGTEVHKVLEATIRGIDWSISKEYKPYSDTLFKFIEEYGVEFMASEILVADPELEYAGTLDAIGIVTKHPPRRRHESLVGKTVLLDIKSNKDGRVYPETHLPQVEAYGWAYTMNTGTDLDENVVIGLGPDGKYSVCVSYARFETFTKILDLYNEFKWMKSNNPNSRS